VAILWKPEACDLECDPQSGAGITRLTTTPVSNLNIYCEQPNATPDGKRIAYTRAPSPDPRKPPYELCVADLERLRVAVIEPEVACHWVGTSSWSGLTYYVRPNGELVCVDLTTLEKRIVMTHWDLPPYFKLQSVSPDQRYLIGAIRQPDFTCAIVRVDLEQRDWRVIFEHDEMLNHLQFNPVHGRDILVQWNRGTGIDHRGEKRHAEGATKGATHFYLDCDGGNRRDLPLAEPLTASSCGHSAWIADTGRIGIGLNWPGMTVRREDLAKGSYHDPRHPQGNFAVVGPDDDAPAFFNAPEHLFNHVNVSKCGKYFVCDSYRNGVPGPIELVVGNITTG